MSICWMFVDAAGRVVVELEEPVVVPVDEHDRLPGDRDRPNLLHLVVEVHGLVALGVRHRDVSPCCRWRAPGRDPSIPWILPAACRLAGFRGEEEGST